MPMLSSSTAGPLLLLPRYLRYVGFFILDTVVLMRCTTIFQTE